MTTRLSMICQGSSAATRMPAFPLDEPLDAADRDRLTVGSVHVCRPDRSWTSPALCARQTAEALRLDARVAPDLRDCGYGRWAGRSFDDVRRSEPEALAEWLADPRSTPHGGEALLCLMDRVASWLDAQRVVPGDVVAVTHASVIRAAVIHALGAPPSSFWRIDAAPLSRAMFTGLPGRWTLSSIGPARERPPGGP